MISAQHLRKDFSSVRAVDDVSFAVGRGEILGLLGPNGAGKTTTIRMVLDILQADGGTITYDGAPIPRRSRNRLGYLPEERGLYRKSKVFDTILYFAELRGMAQGAAKSAAHAWLERFGLCGTRRPQGGGALEREPAEDPVHHRRRSTNPTW